MIDSAMHSLDDIMNNEQLNGAGRPNNNRRPQSARSARAGRSSTRSSPFGTTTTTSSSRSSRGGTSEFEARINDYVENFTRFTEDFGPEFQAQFNEFNMFNEEPQTTRRHHRERHNAAHDRAHARAQHSTRHTTNNHNQQQQSGKTHSHTEVRICRSRVEPI